MKTQLSITGVSQYNDSIQSKYRASACGPTTVHVILNYLSEKHNLDIDINILYQKLGCTKIGLFRWRLIKNLHRYLGPNWNVSRCSLQEALNEINSGRPVAMKFDKYFTFQWKLTPTFKYHWVPLIGYKIINDKLYFIVHDNGGHNRPSQIRKVCYEDNYKVISFVKIKPE